MASLTRQISKHPKVFTLDTTNNQIILANSIVFADGTKQNTAGGSGTDQYARNTANAAFDTANTGFGKANTANLTAQAAYNAANTVVTTNDLIVAGRDANNNIDGLKDKTGNYISGVASYTWSQFTSASFDLTYNRRIIVTDKGGDDESHSLWEIIPTATTGNKRKLLSEPIYFATLNTAPYASQWKGLRIRCGNVGEGAGAILRSDGTYWRPETSKITLLVNNVTHVHNTATLTSAEIAYQIILPTDANGKNIIQENDILVVNEFVWGKTGTNDTTQLYTFIGTKGNTSDTTLLIQGASGNTATMVIVTNHKWIRRADSSGNTVFEKTTTDSISQTGSAVGGVKSSPDTLPFTIDTSSNTVYFSVGYRAGTSTGDSNLKAYHCEMEMTKGF